MKFLKLIILAAVIGGAVYLIKFIDIPDIIGDDEIDIARIEVLKPFIAEYTHEWDNSPKWNLELYKKNLKEAELYRSADDISEAVYDKLRQNVNKDVLNRLVKLLEPDFRADPVPEATVEENMEGITRPTSATITAMRRFTRNTSPTTPCLATGLPQCREMWRSAAVVTTAG